MHLDDNLGICLLSLTSRYPIHTVDFDNKVIAIPEMETRGWTVEEMMAFLESYAPQLLQVPASMQVDESTCEIFLPLYSEKQPALHIHCRGKIPAPHRHFVEKVPCGCGPHPAFCVTVQNEGMLNLGQT